MVDGQAPAHLLEQPRDERDRHAELFAALDLPEQDVARRGGEGDDHVLDAVLLDQPLEIPARTEDRQRQRRLVQRLLVDEADRLEAELGQLEQPACGQRADSAGADDQRGASVLTQAAGLELRPVERDAARSQVDRAEGEQPQRLRRQVVDVARQKDPQGDQGHRGERGRRDDLACALEHREPKLPRVHAAQVEEEHGETAVDHEPGRTGPRRCRRGWPPAATSRAAAASSTHVQDQRAAGPRAEPAAPERDFLRPLELERFECRKRLGVHRSHRHRGAFGFLASPEPGRACAGLRRLPVEPRHRRQAA